MFDALHKAKQITAFHAIRRGSMLGKLLHFVFDCKSAHTMPSPSAFHKESHDQTTHVDRYKKQSNVQQSKPSLESACDEPLYTR